jgi:hypothetical protein
MLLLLKMSCMKIMEMHFLTSYGDQGGFIQTRNIKRKQNGINK